MNIKTMHALMVNKHHQLTNQRHDRTWIEPDTGHIAWLRFEVMGMYWAVNDFRRQMGKDPIPLEKVEQVESMASGHVDYSSKFPLYCAELVLND